MTRSRNMLIESVQDATVTSPALGMKTSAGSTAIASLKAKRNSTVVEKVRVSQSQEVTKAISGWTV